MWGTGHLGGNVGAFVLVADGFDFRRSGLFFPHDYECC